jgi:succinoglycan biosynthesis transport protein ExoP
MNPELQRQAAVDLNRGPQALRGGAQGEARPDQLAAARRGGQPPGSGEPPGYSYGAYTAAGTELAGNANMLDLRNLLSILRRRKYLILGLVALALVGASLYVSQLTPLYQASAVIVIEPDRTKVLDVDAVVRDLPGDLLTVQTEAAKIGSRAVALGAAERLGLISDPRFNPNLAPPPAADRGFSLRGLFDDLLALVGLAEPKPAEPLAPPARISDEALLREAIAGRFLGGLSVSVGERSRLITITYVSTDPSFAALAANAVALSYIEGQISAIGGETTRAAGVVQEKLTELEAELTQARTKLEAYRSQHGLTDINGSTLQSTQLASLNGDLITARNRLTEAEVRYDQVKRMLEGGGGSAETAAAVVESSMVQSLRSQEIELSREVSELSTKYRDGHPKMIEARARLKEIQSKLWSEVRKVGALLKNEVEIARGQVANLEAAIEGIKTEVTNLSGFQAQLSALQADVEAKSKQYDAMLERYNEIAVQAGANEKPDAELITQAQTPGAPFSPRSNMIVGMAAAAAAILGLVLAIGLEFLDSGFRSLSQIEGQTGMPTLGMVPMIAFKNAKSGLPHHFATARHGSIFAEAIRTVRTNLLLSDAGRPPRVVLVTSSMPNEGKTTTVLSIASQTVQTGRRCIVVDCDMRQASVDESLGHPNHLGLSDFLANSADLAQIIGVDERTGVHFIGAGTQANPPVELLGSARMKNLINALAQSYHLVVLDTPPLLAVSDALVLLREADATVFLIRWGKTPRDTAKLGLKSALEAGARVAGVVLSYVDVRKHAQYTYADSGHYYNKAYRKYYYSK